MLGSLYVFFNLALATIALLMLGSAQRRHQQERDKWQVERKDLLDRIQAPSFAEYANKIVREKKAEQPKEEEKAIEFIS